MCGVIAFYHPAPGELEYRRLSRLFTQSKIRGTHAYGFAYFSQSFEAGAREYKSFVLEDSPTALLSELEAVLRVGADRPFLLVGHNRYSTGGDWQELSNNQPLTIHSALGRMSLVFNGTLDTREPAAWAEDYEFEFTTANDGEIYLRRLEAGMSPVAALKTHQGTFAGAILREIIGGATPAYEAIALRNAMRPLWIAEDESGGRYVASTRDIFERACPELTPSEIPPLTPLHLGTVEVVPALVEQVT